MVDTVFISGRTTPSVASTKSNNRIRCIEKGLGSPSNALATDNWRNLEPGRRKTPYQLVRRPLPTVANFRGMQNFVTVRLATKITKISTPRKLPAIRYYQKFKLICSKEFEDSELISRQPAV